MLSIKLAFGNAYLNTTIALKSSTQSLFDSMMYKYPHTKLQDAAYIYGNTMPVIIVYKEPTCKKTGDTYEIKSGTVKIMLKPNKDCTIEELTKIDYDKKYKIISEGDIIRFHYLDICPTFISDVLNPVDKEGEVMWLKSLSELNSTK